MIYSSFRLKVGALVAGIVLMALGALVYLSMQTSMSDCGSFVGQLGRAFSGDFAQRCEMASLMQVGAGILVVIGLGLLIYGAVATSGSKPRRFYCKHCGSESDTLEGIRYHIQQYHENNSVDSKQSDVKNLGILKERLAKGEITKEEYDDLKKEFES